MVENSEPLSTCKYYSDSHDHDGMTSSTTASSSPGEGSVAYSSTQQQLQQQQQQEQPSPAYHQSYEPELLITTGAAVVPILVPVEISYDEYDGDPPLAMVVSVPAVTAVNVSFDTNHYYYHQHGTIPFAAVGGDATVAAFPCDAGGTSTPVCVVSCSCVALSSSQQYQQHHSFLPEQRRDSARQPQFDDHNNAFVVAAEQQQQPEQDQLRIEIPIQTVTYDENENNEIDDDHHHRRGSNTNYPRRYDARAGRILRRFGDIIQKNDNEEGESGQHICLGSVFSSMCTNQWLTIGLGLSIIYCYAPSTLLMPRNKTGLGKLLPAVWLGELLLLDKEQQEYVLERAVELVVMGYNTSVDYLVEQSQHLTHQKELWDLVQENTRQAVGWVRECSQQELPGIVVSTLYQVLQKSNYFFMGWFHPNPAS